MVEATEVFARDCARLPGSLKSWQAYKELKVEIDEMTEVLPLVYGLAKPSIMERHWLEICDIFKTEIPYNKETFCLRDLLTVKLLDKREDLEDIADSADKQLKLEN